MGLDVVEHLVGVEATVGHDRAADRQRAHQHPETERVEERRCHDGDVAVLELHDAHAGGGALDGADQVDVAGHALGETGRAGRQEGDLGRAVVGRRLGMATHGQRVEGEPVVRVALVPGQDTAAVVAAGVDDVGYSSSCTSTSGPCRSRMRPSWDSVISVLRKTISWPSRAPTANASMNPRWLRQSTAKVARPRRRVHSAPAIDSIRWSSSWYVVAPSSSMIASRSGCLAAPIAIVAAGVRPVRHSPEMIRAPARGPTGRSRPERAVAVAASFQRFRSRERACRDCASGPRCRRPEIPSRRRRGGADCRHDDPGADAPHGRPSLAPSTPDAPGRCCSAVAATRRSAASGPRCGAPAAWRPAR